MTRPAPPCHQTEARPRYHTAPLWELSPPADETRIVWRRGRARPLELVADPFSS